MGRRVASRNNRRILADAPAASAPWTPTDFADLDWWLIASEGVTLAGSEVSSWANQADGGGSFVQAGANKPDFTASFQNDKPAITFAASDVLDLAGGTLVQPFTMYVVVRPTGLLYTQPFLISADTAMEFRFENDNVQVFAGETAFVGPVTSTLTILEYVINEASSSIGINSAGATVDVGTFDGGGGSISLGSGGFTGDITEIIMYGRVLTAEERTTVREALASSYNISGVT